MRISCLQKNGNRIYEVGGRNIELSKSYLNTLQGWSTNAFNVQTKHDQKLVDSLLIFYAGAQGVTFECINEVVKDFIRGKS